MLRKHYLEQLHQNYRTERNQKNCKQNAYARKEKEMKRKQDFGNDSIALANSVDFNSGQCNSMQCMRVCVFGERVSDGCVSAASATVAECNFYCTLKFP